MKKFRVFSLLLALIVISASFVFPNAPKVEAATESSSKSTVATLASKSDFEYKTQSSRIYIRKYIGSATKIIIPETIDGLPVFAIASNAFSSSDITYLKLPASLNVLGNNAFNECDSLTQIDVNEANANFCSIDGVVFSKSKTTLKAFPAGRTGSYLIPDGVTEIAPYAFYRCYQLENLNMYNTVTTIGERAFSFCWGLGSVRFSDNLKTIGAMAFSHCDNLTALHLPKSITSIGSDAFLGRINSNDSSKEYYLVDGVYALKGSYPARYIKSLGLNYINTPPTYTNVEAGISVTDTKNIFPSGASLEVDIHSLSSINEDFSSFNHTDGFVVDIYLSTQEGVTVPNGTFKINFDASHQELIPTATKVFSSRVGDIELLTNQPSLKSATFETDTLGTYIILLCNDFSLKGDINGDGRVTVADARLALLAAANIIPLTKEQISAGDVITTGTDKNVITTADARRILRTVAGLK